MVAKILFFLPPAGEAPPEAAVERSRRWGVSFGKIASSSGIRYSRRSKRLVTNHHPHPNPPIKGREWN